MSIEPISGTATAAVSFGLTTLLAGWLGQVGADVMMVVLSAIAGSMMALTEKKKTFLESLKFIFLGVLVAAVLAWAISSMIASQYPSLSSPYLPTIVAFILGFTVDKFPSLLDLFLQKIFSKV